MLIYIYICKYIYSYFVINQQPPHPASGVPQAVTTQCADATRPCAERKHITRRAWPQQHREDVTRPCSERSHYSVVKMSKASSRCHKTMCRA